MLREVISQYNMIRAPTTLPLKEVKCPNIVFHEWAKKKDYKILYLYRQQYHPITTKLLFNSNVYSPLQNILNSNLPLYYIVSLANNLQYKLSSIYNEIHLSYDRYSP